VVNAVDVPPSSRRVRFGAFEADLAAGELHRQGVKVRLSAQPFSVLAVLLERPGDVVTREDLRQRLWPADTYVDFDHGLNAAVNKLREALGDSAGTPRYIETLPRKGYRFIAPVNANGDHGPAAVATPAAEVPRRTPMAVLALLAAGLTAAAVALVALTIGRRPAASAPTPPPIRSLAVLPFANLSHDTSQEVFADGMTDALICHLAQIGSMRVISRTSVMQFKDTRKSLPEIGQALKVDAVVEGTVLRSGDRVAVSAKLVRASTDESLWAQNYEGLLGDVLTLQGELAEAIARQIRLEVTGFASRARSVDPQAYEAYLWGRYYQDKQLGWATEKALPLFEQAIARDPGFARAYVGLAESAVYGYPPKESMAKARAAALRAVELNPALAEAHAALGLVQTYADHDWAAAERSFKQAIELEPNLSDAHHRYSLLLAAVGRLDQAVAESRRALDLDPLSSGVGHTLGRLLYFSRDYPAAIAQYRRTLERDPQSFWARLFLSIALEQTGAYREAATEWARAYEGVLAGMEGPLPRVPADLTQTLAGAGTAEGYREFLRKRTQWEAKLSSSAPVSSSSVAMLYAKLGEKDAALRWLERSVESHTRDLIFLNVEPAYDSLRDDARFKDLVRRVGLPT
jgi:TolB-like protein/DNA-binding winged helix-turn-helix (wHTH) protein/Tfp pilus assembly protein PilF